jgi:hypothetical protein
MSAGRYGWEMVAGYRRRLPSRLEAAVGRNLSAQLDSCLPPVTHAERRDNSCAIRTPQRLGATKPIDWPHFTPAVALPRPR